VKNIEPRRVQDRLISDEYVWSAIRYLDPDEKGENGWSRLLATVFVGLICGVLILILLRVA
jgi:hypothetical protein